MIHRKVPFCCLFLGLLCCLGFSANAQSVYLNAVRFLPETGEFYLELPFSVREDYRLFQQLENQATVHPHSHIDMERKRLPLAVAQQYFDLSPYRDLLIFNAAHELVCEATFQGVELFRDYESYFVAVLKSREGYVARTAVQTDLYCLSKAAEPRLIPRFLSRPLQAASLDERITAHFQLSPENSFSLHHTVLYPANTVYSVLSYSEQRPTALRTHSYLLETLGTELSLLMEVQGETGAEEIYSLLPIPIRINKRPVLLLRMGLTDTDLSWPQLAVYDGSGYQLMEGHWLRAE